MNVFIDLQGAQTPGSRNRGIGRYTRDLATALVKLAPQKASINLGWNSLLPNPLNDLRLQPPVHTDVPVIAHPYGTVARAKYDFRRYDVHQQLNDRLFRYAVARSQCDHLLFSSLIENDTEYFCQPLNLNFGPNTISYCIVYDIIPLLFKEHYLNTRDLFDSYMSKIRLALSADLIFTISDTTRSDLISVLNVSPEQVVTIGTGIDVDQFQQPLHGANELDGLIRDRKPYLLFLGGDEFRKNLPGFLEAYCLLPNELRVRFGALVVGKVSERARAAADKVLLTHGVHPDSVQFVEKLNQTQLVEAYVKSALVVIPSLYEGFGLPVLEAMACNAPLIVSNNSSLSDVMPDDAFLFDPRNAQNMASKMEFALSDSVRVKSLKAQYPSILKKYHWNSVAERIYLTMQEAQSRKERATASAAPIRHQNEDLGIVLTSRPDAQTVAAITELADEYIITVYYLEPFPEIEALPVLIDRITNLWKHAHTGSLTLHFARSFAELQMAAQRYPVFNMIGLLDGSTDQPIIGDSGLGYYAIWPARPIDVSAKVRQARFFYRNGSPYILARDLKHTLKNSNQWRNYKSAVSDAAWISTLQRQELFRTDTQKTVDDGGHKQAEIHYSCTEKHEQAQAGGFRFGVTKKD